MPLKHTGFQCCCNSVATWLKMRSFVLITVVVALLLGCKKQEDRQTIPPAGDYFPLTQGSNWHYTPDNSNTGFVLYGDVTGTTTVNGKTYSVLNYDPGNTNFANFISNSLFRKQDGKYYQLITNRQLYFPLDEPGHFEFVFMEDNAPVGTNWISKIVGTFTFSNGSVRMEEDYDGKISEYYPTFQLDDTHTYSDVVRVTMDMYSQSFAADNTRVGEVHIVYDQWYARDKGLIKTVDYSPSGFAVRLDTLELH